MVSDYNWLQVATRYSNSNQIVLINFQQICSTAIKFSMNISTFISIHFNLFRFSGCDNMPH